MSEQEREPCGKNGCDQEATIIIKVYTTGQADFIAFCFEHLTTAIKMIGELDEALSEQMKETRSDE